MRDDLAIVQTVDFFPPIVDDPLFFGRIAATNALSDVYAMGGRPVTALNIMGVPRELVGGEIMLSILQGGAEQIRAAGAELLGGHTVEDSEIKYGLAVTGVIDPRRVVTNQGAKAGDLLVLTKPLGIGAVTTGIKTRRAPEAAVSEALRLMTTLNRAASEAMLEAGAHAATDVTGYGLFGHAGHMAEASGVTLLIRPNEVPSIDGARALLRKGGMSRGTERNRAQLGPRISGLEKLDALTLDLCFDVQTSGGLLIALPPEALDALLQALETGDTPARAVVGEVVEREEKPLRVEA